MIGHNGGPTFDDIVRDNLDRGLLLTMKETILTAIRDPRLDRRHLRVLAEVIACINSVSGSAYPSRKTIADATARYAAEGVRETQGYSETTINKTLSELVAFGYLISTKRAVEAGGRALSIYSIRKPTTEELQDQITQWIEAVRKAPPRKSDFTPGGKVSNDPDRTYGGKLSRPVFTSVGKDKGKDSLDVANFTPGGNVMGGDFTPVGKDRVADFTPGSDVTTAGKDRADFTSDFTPVLPTVTRTPELGEREKWREREGAGERVPQTVLPAPAPTTQSTALAGEEHVGHGVYANGETIRHAAFAISVPGIRMQTINSGLTANEVRDACIAHALQWGLEIENGARPDKVLPSKIANFLARSIMGDINQRKIQTVREARAAQPYATRPAPALGTNAESGAPVESKADRLRREAKERMAAKVSGAGQ